MNQHSNQTIYRQVRLLNSEVMPGEWQLQMVSGASGPGTVAVLRDANGRLIPLTSVLVATPFAEGEDR